MAFVYLHSFIEPALATKNELRSRCANRAGRVQCVAAERRLVQLKRDYEGYYRTVRHSLAAHRQDLPLEDAIEAWNQVDSDTLDWFIEEARGCWADLRALDPTLPAGSQLEEETHREFLAEVSAAFDPPSDKAELSFDTLALSHPRRIGLIPTHPIQGRAAEIVSILEMIDMGVWFSTFLQRSFASQLLIQSMLVVDLVNLIDDLYGGSAGRVDHRQDSFIEILGAAQHPGESVLQTAISQLDHAAIRTVRSVRNDIAGHVSFDPARNLAGLMKELVDLDETTLNSVYVPARQAFYDACAADLTTRIFLISGRPQSDLRVEPIPDAVRGFDRS